MSDHGFSPVVARTESIHRRRDPIAYDCVKLIFVRAGSAWLFSEFGERPVRVGDVVLLAANTLCGAEPEQRVTVTTLFLHEIGVILRMARASTLEVLNLDYITHARAKGLSEATVMWRHAFRNAFGPTWTLLGLILGNLLGGIAVVETVFTIPGLGRLLVDAIFARDYPVIQGCLLFTACVYVLVNLIVDLLYPFFDPKVTAK